MLPQVLLRLHLRQFQHLFIIDLLDVTKTHLLRAGVVGVRRLLVQYVHAPVHLRKGLLASVFPVARLVAHGAAVRPVELLHGLPILCEEKARRLGIGKLALYAKLQA